MTLCKQCGQPLHVPAHPDVSAEVAAQVVSTVDLKPGELVELIAMWRADGKAEGVREERERCALLVEEWADDQDTCAAAIRAGVEPEDPE